MVDLRNHWLHQAVVIKIIMIIMVKQTTKQTIVFMIFFDWNMTIACNAILEGSRENVDKLSPYISTFQYVLK